MLNYFMSNGRSIRWYIYIYIFFAGNPWLRVPSIGAVGG
jgi:hypothetical protein